MREKCSYKAENSLKHHIELYSSQISICDIETLTTNFSKSTRFMDLISCLCKFNIHVWHGDKGIINGALYMITRDIIFIQATISTLEA